MKAEYMYIIGFLVICCILATREAKDTPGRRQNNDIIGVDVELEQLLQEMERSSDKTANEGSNINVDDLQEEERLLKLLLENKRVVSERKRGWWYSRRNSNASAPPKTCTFCDTTKLRASRSRTRRSRG